MHSSYTPRVCRALPCVSELPATELLYIKMYVNKINDSLNMQYLLKYENVFKYNKQSNNAILFLPVQSH